MADFAVRFNDFSGGDWGDADPAKVKANQFSGKNVHPYGSGLLGIRPGWKLLDLTGKVAGGTPANYTGLCRGFDLMRDHLTLVIDTKSYDIYWDLGLVGGTLPNQAPATLPGGLPALAFAQLLWSQDPGGVKEWLLCNGTLYLKSTGATPAWQALSGVGGAVAPPNPLSVLARWGLYLVAAEQTVPWRIRFSQVDAAGPNFLQWPANNYLDMSTTDPVTTLKGIFNLLYVGKASGWFAISGVLGVLASVRELAIGNGPIDNRAASVTTDNRVVYWPLQKVPAFWNGERVSLVDDQRMDPRTTWLDATPVMAMTAPPAGGGFTPPNAVRIFDGQLGYMGMPTVLRSVSPAWTATGTRAAGTATSADFNYSPASMTPLPLPPGWTTLPIDTRRTSTGVVWNLTGGGMSPASTIACRISGELLTQQGNPFPVGSVLALFVNGVERARSLCTVPMDSWFGVGAETAINAGDVVTLQFFNPLATTFNAVVYHQVPQQNHSPYLAASALPNYTIAGRIGWICPATDTYTLHAEMQTGDSTYELYITVNGIPVASASARTTWWTAGTPGVPVTLERTMALNAGDVVGLGGYTSHYNTNSGYVLQGGSSEADATPLLRLTRSTPQQQVGVLGMFGESVVVTPTERRLLMAGDDGVTTKVWSYGGNIWTHHEHAVLIAGFAPSDVRMSYLLPEHVVFATKRSYNNEPLKVWSINHDLDRPAFVSDQWASPWDQSMQGGDVLVKGEVSLPMWFDGQGRQCRARSVIVQFVKWNQGIAGGDNQISARVDSVGPYNRGVTPGTEATWSEPMTAAAATLDGTEDSWRFNVGEQGWGNGFQLVFTALYGVAIREVVVLVDLRTERT